MLFNSLLEAQGKKQHNKVINNPVDDVDETGCAGAAAVGAGAATVGAGAAAAGAAVNDGAAVIVRRPTASVSPKYTHYNKLLHSHLPFQLLQAVCMHNECTRTTLF